MSCNYGLLFVGSRGHLATTTALGALALEKELSPPTGMVSEKPFFEPLALPSPSDFIFGGWDIRSTANTHAVLKECGLNDPDTLVDLAASLDAIHAGTQPGIALNAGSAISELCDPPSVVPTDTISHAIDKVAGDISDFKKKHGIEQVVVINLASTEPPIDDPGRLSSMESLEALIKENQVHAIRPSLVYAVAAITSGCAWINFTPSHGGMSRGLVELAKKQGVPVMGSDGKTGETLMKSALAPMFAMRNLEVMSWEGYNILGNMDGRVLQHAENGSTKIQSKDRLLPHILGYRPHSRVSIDYVPSLGDHKTAWDFIHFKGFLNTKMSLQFTWQGCDSALAAPLVLDLARFALFALNNGESGAMPHLASFFKSPWEIDEHSLAKQYALLEAYGSKHAQSTNNKTESIHGFFSPVK